MTDLRCSHRMHGRLSEVDGRLTIEVACRSELCGKRPGVIVLHEFDRETGDLVETRFLRDTPKLEEGRNGVGSCAAVRHA